MDLTYHVSSLCLEQTQYPQLKNADCREYCLKISHILLWMAG